MPITKSTSAGTIIKDFEKSDNPKFAGKSKEERKRMALGAYYGKHPEKSNKPKNEDVEVMLNNIVSEDKETVAKTIQEVLMAKVAVKLEEMKQRVADKYFNNIDESSELMTRKHLEHIADHVAKTKDDEHLHGALKDVFHKTGRHLNSNFRHDYFNAAADGKGRKNRSSGDVHFTKTHKDIIHNAIDNHLYGDEELKHKAHDWATETLDK